MLICIRFHHLKAIFESKSLIYLFANKFQTKLYQQFKCVLQTDGRI